MVTLNITPSLQDYLEVILELSLTDEEVRITDISESMNIAKPSVNEAVNNLVGLDLVTHDRYGPVILTARGREEAVKIRGIHDTIASFLRDVLGVDAEVAEQDACRMEHFVSSQTIQCILEYTKKERS
jgi:DtxR family Mn-dependent transcriptional regulator